MKKITCVFILCALVFSSCFLTSCEKKDKQSLYNNQKIDTLSLPKDQKDSVVLNIYFDSSKGNTVEIAKEEREIVKEELIGEAIINELIKGPSIKSDLKPVLPKESKLLSFSIKEGIAYVNFNQQTIMPLSKEKEKVTLDCIVNSLTQLESIKKVQILIENSSDASIGGNYDLSKPLEKGGSYEEKK